ncbi:MAG: hypothetical protein ACE5FA_04590, partial [Dehalococcoidia bacterium]
ATPEPTPPPPLAATETPVAFPPTGGANGSGPSSVGLLLLIGGATVMLGISLLAYGRNSPLRRE